MNPVPETPLNLLAIVLQGGVVQSVVATVPLPDVDLLVIDYDTEGVDPDRLMSVPQADGALSDATAGFLNLEYPRIDLAAVVAQVMRRADSGDCVD
jgi:hypothetical protein